MIIINNDRTIKNATMQSDGHVNFIAAVYLTTAHILYELKFNNYKSV